MDLLGDFAKKLGNDLYSREAQLIALREIKELSQKLDNRQSILEEKNLITGLLKVLKKKDEIGEVKLALSVMWLLSLGSQGKLKKALFNFEGGSIVKAMRKVVRHKGDGYGGVLAVTIGLKFFVNISSSSLPVAQGLTREEGFVGELLSVLKEVRLVRNWKRSEGRKAGAK